MLQQVSSIVVLISGAGSNLQALVRACAEQAWPARVAAVLSNRADAAGLAFAARQGIACEVLDHRDAASREDYDRELARRIDAYEPALLVLAGFMRLLTPWFVRRYEGRMVNVHPSLLPSFAGLHTHRRALEAGVKWHGATVHLVTPEMDAGPILAQAVVPVLDDDTEQSLAARVLEQEHRIYPDAVRALIEGRVRVQGQRARVLARPEPGA